jgi:hypothetical protein
MTNDISGNVFLTGYFEGTQNFSKWGTTNLTSLGDEDIFVLKLSPCTNSSSTITATACDLYIAPDSSYHYSSGQKTVVIGNVDGCDSVITINLTIENSNNVNSNVTQSGSILTAVASGPTVSYQWVDCNNSNAPIVGETNPSFSPTTNGRYGVEVTEGACTVSSFCINVTNLSISQLKRDLGILVYPNPAVQWLTIDKGENFEIEIQLTDNLGHLVLSKTSTENLTKLDLEHLPKGAYYLTVNNGKQISTQKLLIE